MTDDLERLGRYVRDRRHALGLTQREAVVIGGMSDQTWGNVEKGVAVTPRKLADVERALRWEPGSASAVLSGGEPTVVEARPSGSGRTLLERIEALEAAVSPAPARPGETLDERVARLEREVGLAPADQP